MWWIDLVCDIQGLDVQTPVQKTILSSRWHDLHCWKTADQDARTCTGRCLIKLTSATSWISNKRRHCPQTVAACTHVMEICIHLFCMPLRWRKGIFHLLKHKRRIGDHSCTLIFPFRGLVFSKARGTKLEKQHSPHNLVCYLGARIAIHLSSHRNRNVPHDFLSARREPCDSNVMHHEGTPKIFDTPSDWDT